MIGEQEGREYAFGVKERRFVTHLCLFQLPTFFFSFFPRFSLCYNKNYYPRDFVIIFITSSNFDIDLFCLATSQEQQLNKTVGNKKGARLDQQVILLASRYLCDLEIKRRRKERFHMSPQSVSKTSKSLEGLHGVHVVSHSPFAFERISQVSSFDSSDAGTKQSLFIERVWQQRPPCLRPIHCCIHGDQSVLETAANVITSLPFIFLGMQTPRKNLNMKVYANSLIGVGIASSLYHSSRGKLRKYLRWADYTMIATATVCLSRALREENPKFLMAASALALPFQPLVVSAVHTGMMEVAFAKRALKDPDLRMAHNVHKMSSLLGGALFIADDLFPETPFIHAGWHLAAAIGVGTCNKLLQ